MTYAEIVNQATFQVSQLVEHWEELQDLATGVEDPYVKEQIAQEEEAIETFFEDLGYGPVQEVANEPNGETYNSLLIRENHFEDYIREMFEDDIPQGFPAYIYIDWERTAEDEEHNYTEAELPLYPDIPNGMRITFKMRAW